MRAVSYSATGEAKDVLVVGTLPDPEPLEGEVLVALKSSGINPSDVKTRAGARGPLAFPQVIPHSDGAGTVAAVGSGVDTARIGERVWLWNAAWQRPFGTAAQYTALPAHQAVPLPDTTPFEAGACLGIPASTACHGVLGLGPVAGKTVLVTGGAGAVGHYAIQIAKHSGARVVSTVSSDGKAAVARQAGADQVVNYREQDVAEAVLEATGGEGVDHVVEVEFGGNLDATSRIIKTNGSISTYGSMMQPTPPLPFYDLMFKCLRLDLFLVYLLEEKARSNVIRKLTDMMAEEKLQHNIAAQFELDEAVLAHEAVEQGKHIGNVVLNIE